MSQGMGRHTRWSAKMEGIKGIGQVFYDHQWPFWWRPAQVPVWVDDVAILRPINC